MEEVTLILSAVEQGEPQAAERLLALVYCRIATAGGAEARPRKAWANARCTGLVHEAYVRLFGGEREQQHWDSRGHFFAAAAEAMRRILIDNARRKQRREAWWWPAAGDVGDIASAIPDDDLLALDEALEKLAAQDPIKAADWSNCGILPA